MFKKNAHHGQFVRFAAPKNIANTGREYSNRASFGPKYKEETGIKGGSLTTQAHTLQRRLAVQ